MKTYFSNAVAKPSVVLPCSTQQENLQSLHLTWYWSSLLSNRYQGLFP